MNASGKRIQTKRSSKDTRTGETLAAPVTPRYSFEDFIRWEM
jgi:hypothetical protein